MREKEREKRGYTCGVEIRRKESGIKGFTVRHDDPKARGYVEKMHILLS